MVHHNPTKTKKLLPYIDELMERNIEGQNIVRAITDCLEEVLAIDDPINSEQPILDPHSEVVLRKIKELVAKHNLAGVLELLNDVQDHVKPQKKGKS